jgi:hypothetical protein
LRSYKEREQKALEKVTLKRCLKQLKESRKREGICKLSELNTPWVITRKVNFTPLMNFITMNTITLDKKKYVIIEQAKFEEIQLEAARKVEPVKKLSLAKGKQLAYKLIDKWVKEK